MSYNNNVEEMRHLNLSKCFKIYDIAIFHSIYRETCDEMYYDIGKYNFVVSYMYDISYI